MRNQNVYNLEVIKEASLHYKTMILYTATHFCYFTVLVFLVSFNGIILQKESLNLGNDSLV